MGFPGDAMKKNLAASAGDPRDVDSIPRVRKIPWRRKWQPTPVFLPGKSHGQRLAVTVHWITELNTTEHDHEPIYIYI